MAEDMEQDPIDLSIVDASFDDLDSTGFELTMIESNSGIISGLVEWEPDCGTFDFDENRFFQASLQLSDDDPCDRLGGRVTLNLIADYNCDEVVTGVSEEVKGLPTLVAFSNREMTIQSPKLQEEVAVYDLSGKLLFHQVVSFQGQSANIDLKTFTRQMYIVRVDD